jgi:hypothetical protein
MQKKKAKKQGNVAHNVKKSNQYPTPDKPDTE